MKEEKRAHYPQPYLWYLAFVVTAGMMVYELFFRHPLR